MKAFIKNIVMGNAFLRAITTPLWHLYRRLTIGYLSVEDLPGRIHYNDIFDPNNLDHYKSVSFDALSNIENSLKDTSQSWENIENCLLFACGYGRELRLIATKMPSKKITACDINERAVNFCKSEFEATPLLSSESFKTMVFPCKFSLIWCGSLFTHLPEERFRELFTLLALTLKPGGLLIFTTHEEESFNRLKHYDTQMPPKKILKEKYDNGEFTFSPYPWTTEYGISISPEEYVLELNTAQKRPLQLIRYEKKGWDNHQSVFTFQKI